MTINELFEGYEAVKQQEAALNKLKRELAREARLNKEVANACRNDPNWMDNSLFQKLRMYPAEVSPAKMIKYLESL